MVTGDARTPLIELNLTTNHVLDMLTKNFEGWQVVFTTIKKLSFPIERDGQQILLKTDCLTYVVCKNKGGFDHATHS
ncbi:hypothetical protein D3C86_1848350 [compost metagenome]